MPVTGWSITQNGRYEPFELQVARGQISYHSLVNIFGYQAAVTTAGPYPVWENVSAYTYPVAATTMLLSSASASDINVSVLINGLDANFNPISESLLLTNGTTGVSTTKQYLRINSMFVNGGFTDPVGVLSLTNAGKTVTYAKINVGVNRTQMAIYTVPAGYTFYLNRVDAFVNEAGGGNNYSTYQVYTKNNVTGQNYILLTTPFIGRYEARRVVPFPYTEKVDIQWQCSVGTSTSPIGIVIEGILIQNDAST